MKISALDLFKVPPRLVFLKVTTDEALVWERARTGHDWKAPIWRNADGTVAEW